MDAQRRRKLIELARLHEQWRAQHGWLLVADELAGAVPPDPHLLPEADRRQAREQLAAAAVAAARLLPDAGAARPLTDRG